MRTYDTHRVGRNGRHVQSYSLVKQRRGELEPIAVVFEGDDYTPAAYVAPDSDAAVVRLLELLVDGSADDVTDEQRAWLASGQAEALVAAAYERLDSTDRCGT